MGSPRLLLALILGATVLTACSGGGGTSAFGVPERSSSDVARTHPAITTALIYACYGLRKECVWFERGHARPKGVISGLDTPDALAVDNTGNVYIVNAGAANDIVVYPAGSTTLSKTLTDPGTFPDGVAVDAKGTVFVANIHGPNGGPGDIEIYENGSTTPTRTLDDPSFGSVNSVAVDENDELIACYFTPTFVKRCAAFANAQAPGKPMFYGLFVSSLAFDAAGDVALATKFGTMYLNTTFKKCGADSDPSKVSAVAFDGVSGDVFKAFPPSGDIDEETYTPCAGGTVEYTYNLGFLYLNHPDAVAVDPRGL